MTTIPIGGTEQSWLCTVAINGQTIGVFDTWSGGDTTAPSAQHRAGGQGNMTSYRTLPKFSPMTVSRVLNEAVDAELIRQLRTTAGTVTGSITLQPLDADQNAYGQSWTATGMFLGIKSVKGDSNSEALQIYDLDFSVDAWA